MSTGATGLHFTPSSVCAERRSTLLSARGDHQATYVVRPDLDVRMDPAQNGAGNGIPADLREDESSMTSPVGESATTLDVVVTVFAAVHSTGGLVHPWAAERQVARSMRVARPQDMVGE